MQAAADVGLASVLSQASYVNHLEHQGTFAFAGDSSSYLFNREQCFAHASLMFMAYFASICITHMHRPVRAASRSCFQSLTSAPVLQRRSYSWASKPFMHTALAFLNLTVQAVC